MRSKIEAMPWPPPMHSDTIAYCPSMRSSSYMAFTVRIVPLAPTG